MIILLTSATGGALVLIGLTFYLQTNAITSLISSMIGIVLLLLGVLAHKKAELRKHAIHGAVVIALVAFLSTFMGIVNSVILISGGLVERPLANIAKALVAVVTLIYLTVAVTSFITARKSRLSTNAE